MRIKKTKIGKRIYLLEFDSQYELTSTFLRFQEFYESPKFKGKIFSLKEFKKWYKSVKGKFSYYKDWNGFNIPSYILKPFFEGKFDPLSNKEKKLLSLFKNKRLNFYIIAIHRYKKEAVLKHEIAHALFYIYPRYKKQVLDVLHKFDTKNIKKELISRGYCKDVLDDEVNAHILSSIHKLKTKIPSELKNKLNDIFLNFYNKIKNK